MLTLLVYLWIYSVNSYCDHYFQPQILGPENQERIPFDECFHHISTSGSFKFFCNDSMNFDGNSTNGSTAFRENYRTINCDGPPDSISVVPKPQRIECGSKCDILQLRYYDITNNTTCAYNDSAYHAVSLIVDSCIGVDRDESINVFCSMEETNKSFFWFNAYASNDCAANTIVSSDYYTTGCIPDNEQNPLFPFVGHDWYVEILRCDYELNEELFSYLDPFNESTEPNEKCGNYWMPQSDKYNLLHKGDPVPFDVCYSNHSNIHQDSSFKYICNDTAPANNTLDGYTVFKAHYNATDCIGEPNIFAETVRAESIRCNPLNPCVAVRMRGYTLSPNITQISQCWLMMNDSNTAEPKSGLYQYDYQDFFAVSILPCQHENGHAMVGGCSDDFLFAKIYNADNCDDQETYTVNYKFAGCEPDHGYGISAYTFDCLNSNLESETSNPTFHPSANPSIFPTPHPSSEYHPFDDGITSKESRNWSSKVIGITIGVMIIIGIIIIIICYRRWNNKQPTKDETNLLKLVEGRKAIHEMTIVSNHADNN